MSVAIARMATIKASSVTNSASRSGFVGCRIVWHWTKWMAFASSKPIGLQRVRTRVPGAAVDKRTGKRQVRAIIKPGVRSIVRMKAHIVLAHPEAKSFNAQLSATSERVLRAAGWQTTLSDLYALDFDAREGAHHYRFRKDAEVFHAQTEQRFNADNGTTPADVTSEVQHLLDCDLLVVHFPLWWFGMPAILKGWMDRVFVYGRIYQSTRRYDTGICSGKKMIACVTTGAS
ncbi:MAG: NAD(P)H-dependent oxidoreductase, partial [Hyphomicrobiales bacterium]|nr:NAD(P)H-dependent oxidoreductase [Hyphomicrobiales bacterium]